MWPRTITLKITPTDSDVRLGAPGNCNWCPIALAILRAIKPFIGSSLIVSVAPGSIALSAGNYFSENIAWAGVPSLITSFIHEYDKAGIVLCKALTTPPEFEIRLVINDKHANLFTL